MSPLRLDVTQTKDSKHRQKEAYEQLQLQCIIVGLGLSVLAASSFFSVPHIASVCEAAAMLGRASSEN